MVGSEGFAEVAWGMGKSLDVGGLFWSDNPGGVDIDDSRTVIDWEVVVV